MPDTRVRAAIAAAVHNADLTESVICRATPVISDNDALKVAGAVGRDAGPKEVAAVTEILAKANISPAGQSALTAAIAPARRTKPVCNVAQQLTDHPFDGSAAVALRLSDHAGGWLLTWAFLATSATIACATGAADGDNE
jgi:hypothetical protein